MSLNFYINVEDINEKKDVYVVNKKKLETVFGDKIREGCQGRYTEALMKEYIDVFTYLLNESNYFGLPSCLEEKYPEISYIYGTLLKWEEKYNEISNDLHFSPYDPDKIYILPDSDNILESIKPYLSVKLTAEKTAEYSGKNFFKVYDIDNHHFEMRIFSYDHIFRTNPHPSKELLISTLERYIRYTDSFLTKTSQVIHNIFLKDFNPTKETFLGNEEFRRIFLYDNDGNDINDRVKITAVFNELFEYEKIEALKDRKS